MSLQSDKSSRHRFQGAEPLDGGSVRPADDEMRHSDDAPTRIVLSDDPAQLDLSHHSTVELPPQVPRGSQSKAQALGVAVIQEEKTVISKRTPVDEPPPIHIGPLESRKSLEGETLDHFQLESFVGGGGMGAVYRSYDTRLNRLVAVKILSRDQSDSETVRRFRNEAQSAARLDHANIARVYYVGEDKGWNFIVFEFIEGTNLRQMVESQGPLSIEEALDYTLQVAEALDHAAARDVVHRDIKPSNVLVTADGTVKLVDMGLARLHQVESGQDDLTQSGVTLGTFDYISPEQARDPRLADVRSDIYSLGCTLYFMLVGRPPFPDGTALQKLLRHNGDDPPDVRLFRPDTPDDVVAILTRALAKKREQRFQSPGELIAAIHRVSQRLHLHLGGSSARISVNLSEQGKAGSSWWQRLAPLGVAAAVLLLVVILPELRLGTGSNSPPPLPAGKAVSAAVPGTSESTTSRTTLPLETESNPDRATEPQIGEVKNQNPVDLPDLEETPAVVTPKVDSPGETTTTLVAVIKRKVIVGPESGSTDEPGVHRVSSFAEAVAYLAKNDEVESIELAFNGIERVSSALELSGKSLSIRVASGHTPELVLRSSPDASPASERRLLKVAQPGSQITIEGLRIKFDVPQASPDWALFEVAHGSSLKLERCVLTVVNTSDSVRHAQQVAFIETANPVTTTVADTELADESSRATSVEIQQSVLRGDGTIVRLNRDEPIRVNIAGSFIATAERVLEMPGTLSRPGVSENAELTIENATIYAGKGVVICGNNSLPYRLGLQIACRGSIVATERTSPLIDYRTLIAAEEPALSYRGSDNVYVKAETFFGNTYRHDGIDVVESLSFAELPRWATDRNAAYGTLAAAPETASHGHVPSDYLLKSPSESTVGCIPALLPAVEAAVKRPIMGATNMGTMKSEQMGLTPMTPSGSSTEDRAAP